MDALQILAKDHRAVDQLFEQIEKTDNRGANRRGQLYRKLRNELELHAELEEEFFYPALKEHGDTKELANQALEEHSQVKQMLNEIDDLSAEDDQWSEMINELKMAAQHHMREEEHQIFPAARAKLDEARISELGRKIQEMREKASA
jgi:hemerythrin superfamily protein